MTAFRTSGLAPYLPPRPDWPGRASWLFGSSKGGELRRPIDPTSSMANCDMRAARCSPGADRAPAAARARFTARRDFVWPLTAKY
jgi:hypothetical protein